MKSSDYTLEIFRELGDVHLPVSVRALGFSKCGSILAELSRYEPKIFT